MAGVKKQEDMEGASRKLRSAAEKKVSASTAKTAPLKKPVLDKLMHELRVHQVELEMQNEELRGAQEQIAKSRNDYADLYDFSPVGYLAFNDDALITGANLTGAALLGVERHKLLKRRFRQFVAPADAERWDRHFVSVLQQGEKQSCDLLLRRKDGTTLHARLDSIRVEMDDGTSVVRTAMSDITAERQVQEDLLNQFTILKAIIESPGTPIFLVDRNYCYITFNNSHAAMMKSLFGADIEIGKSLLDYHTVEAQRKQAKQNIDRAISGESVIVESYSGEEQLSRRFIEIVHSPVMNAAGQVIGASVFGRDLTERKQAEEALRLSETRYENLFNNNIDGLCVIDDTMKVLMLNQAAASMFGFASAEEVLGVNPFDYIPPEEQERVLDTVTKDMFENDMKQVHEFRLINKAGKEVWISAVGAVIEYQGKPAGLVSFRDITERRLAVESLQKSEERYRTIARLSSEFAYSCVHTGDDGYKVDWITDAFFTLTGYSEAELREQGCWFFVSHPDDHEMATKPLRELKAGKSDTREFRIVGRDGRILYIINHMECKADPDVPGGLRLFGAVQDITEPTAKKLEYQTILRTTLDGYWLMDMQGHFLDVNQSYCHLTGYSHDELMGMAISDIEAIEQPEEVAKRIKKIKEVGYDRFETRHRHKDGRIIDIEISVNYVPIDNGQLVVFARDITERKLAEETILRSKLLLVSVIDSTPDWMYVKDMQHRFLLVNKSFAEAQNLAPKDMIGRADTDLFSEELCLGNPDKGIRGFHADDNQALQGQMVHNPRNMVTWADGLMHIYDTYKIPLTDQFGKTYAVLVYSRDITQQTKAEEEREAAFNTLKKTLNDAIKTMVKIVEMRDPYTSGHQDKVADLATAIAREMKLGDTRIDQLRMAALIHDIGKMYIPSDILSKPGRLSDIEFSLIRTHAQGGYNIVNGMNFPGVVAQAVLQHHERLDGSGYPNQMKGEDTILEAKILAVADVIEAMASHRPYRSALGIDKALEEIAKNRGKLYDPGVVDTCLELFNSAKFMFKPV